MEDGRQAQATNALNHFNLLTSRFDINPNDGANFGTVYPGQTPTADSPPRNIKPQSEGHVLRYGSQGPEPEGWSLHVERELFATRRLCLAKIAIWLEISQMKVKRILTRH